jgi:hypothetical protein
LEGWALLGLFMIILYAGALIPKSQDPFPFKNFKEIEGEGEQIAHAHT